MTGLGSAGGAGERVGRVTEFDEAVGLGVVVTADSLGSDSPEAAYPFHCTQIAGGSRTIPVGLQVTFSVVAGRLGRWEAAGIRPIPTP